MERIDITIPELQYQAREEIKGLRTSLMFTSEDMKVILVTSCITNEGKSSIALQLANALAELQYRTLLIDSDLRKSVLTHTVSASGVKCGLSHFLSGQCTLSEAVYMTNIPNLNIIFSGTFPPNPAEMLSGNRFGKAMDTLRNSFDYIIVDTAPLGMVTDAQIVAGHCDGAIIILKAAEVKYKLAQDVKDRIEATGCQIIGVVLNQLNRRSRAYSKYYGKRYGKYYGKYSKYYGTKKNKSLKTRLKNMFQL